MTRARTAALYVCGHAHTTDDAALMLDALGLVVDGALTWPEPGMVDIVDIKAIHQVGARRGTSQT